MGAQHCDAETAFGVLRNASQQRNEKLRDIATRIVATTAAGSRASTPPSAP
jgi:AmiR/NasT family two-component response regulator